jgi:hypothetical protein
MANELSWSPEVVEDVEQIATYIERDSAWYAQAVAARFLRRRSPCGSFPNVAGSFPNCGMRRFESASYTAIG